MTKYILLKILAIMLLLIICPLVVRGEERDDWDEKTKSVGLEYFYVEEIILNSSAHTVKLIDLNEDGVKEIIYLYESFSYPQTEAEKFQHPSLYLHILSYNPASRGYQSQQIIKIPAGVVNIIIGNFLPAQGKEIAFASYDNVFCYKIMEQNNSLPPIYDETAINLVSDLSERTIFCLSERYYLYCIVSEGEDINNDTIDDLIIPVKEGFLVCWGPYQNGNPTKTQIIKSRSSSSIKATSDTF
jgi:hypothetical protein